MGEEFCTEYQLENFRTDISTGLTELLKETVGCSTYFYNDGLVLDFSIAVLNEGVAWFRLTVIPHSRIMVSYAMYINSKYRGKGVAQFLQKIKERMCKKLGFKGMLCTVNKDNAVQIHILEKFGWTKIHQVSESELMYYKGV